MRVEISLACSECKSRNYRTTKKVSGQVALKKFCKVCQKHTMHRESK